MDYININKKMWEFTANIYQNEGFEETLQEVQQPDFTTFDETEDSIFKSEIDLKGKSVIQIGCNNGTEIISLKKNGAGFCLGIDISTKFITQAKKISEVSGQEVTFENINIYEIDEEYFSKFDLVYITVGVLGWMPDLKTFFKIAYQLLKPNGKVFIYEQHPILGIFNPEPPHNLDASYFQKEPFRDEIIPEYIDKEGKYKAISYWFPYTVSDIITNCLTTDFTLVHFKEYAKDLSDTYKLLESNKIELPLSFSLIAKKT